LIQFHLLNGLFIGSPLKYGPAVLRNEHDAAYQNTIDHHFRHAWLPEENRLENCTAPDRREKCRRRIVSPEKDLHTDLTCANSISCD